jgi:hypothetical protein
MKAMRWKFRALCGTASLILCGCWTSAPYGYGTYPGYYAPPPNQGFVVPPGGTMSPGVTYPPPQLGPPGMPGSGPNWQPAPSNGPPTIAPPMGPSGPSGQLSPLPGAPPQTFNGGGPSTFSEPQIGSTRRPENPVPDPVELPGQRTAPGPVGPPPSDQNTSPFGSDGDKQPFEKGTQMQVPKRDDGGPQAVATDGTEPFEAPLERLNKRDSGLVAVAAKTVDGASTDVKTADSKQDADAPNRFDYDRKSYSYLRGVVDFNPRDNAWHIIYSPKPERNDKYGGAFQLVDNPRLNKLHDGDIVFVQGRVNLQQIDSRGKPKYEIGDEVARITYRGTQAVGN